MKELLFIVSVCTILSVKGQAIEGKKAQVQMTPEMTEVWTPQPKVV